jgi:hypothetical protein
VVLLSRKNDPVDWIKRYTTKLPTVKKIGNIIKTQEFNIENLQRIRNYIRIFLQ